jgi:GGDEF domain-containing protein
MGIIDKFDDTVRLNLRRFGLTALPLFSVTVALNAPLEVALLCGTSCSALALLGSRPAKIRPTVGRQMYRTSQYLSANFAPCLENSTNKPCLLFAMQLDRLDTWRTRFGRNATRALLQHAYDRINGALRNDDVIIHTSDHQFYALVVVNDLCDLAATLDIGNRLQKAIDPGFQIDGRSHYFSLFVGIADSRHHPQVTAKRLIRSANSALTRARYSGDGQMRLFSPDMDQNAKSKPRVTSPALRTALYDRKIRT